MNKSYFTDDEGHMLDDPLFIINAKPDFKGLGLPPQETKKSKEL